MKLKGLLDREEAVEFVSRIQQLIREELDNRANAQWPSFEAEAQLIDFLAGDLPMD